MPAEIGSRTTLREMQLFHAWLVSGRSVDAAAIVGTSPENVSSGLFRLTQRFGVKHAVQLVRPLIISPLYSRIRHLETENRRLRTLVSRTLGTYHPYSTRLVNGGIGTRRHRRRWRKARAAAAREGFVS